jgi:hypothetical protein
LYWPLLDGFYLNGYGHRSSPLGFGLPKIAGPRIDLPAQDTDKRQNEKCYEDLLHVSFLWLECRPTYPILTNYCKFKTETGSIWLHENPQSRFATEDESVLVCTPFRALMGGGSLTVVNERFSTSNFNEKVEMGSFEVTLTKKSYYQCVNLPDRFSSHRSISGTHPAF